MRELATPEFRAHAAAVIWPRVRVTQDPNECWLYWRRALLVHLYGRSYRVRRLIYLLLTGELPPDGTLMHFDCPVRCVNPLHARFVSPQELGRATSPRTKLTPQLVGEIHRLAASGMTYREIAPQVGVTPDHVSAVARGKYWTDEHPYAVYRRAKECGKEAAS